VTFDAAFQHTVGLEGRYSNHASDTGGATKFGITERVARANGYTDDMRRLPLEKAKEIYRKQYWDTLKLDDIDKLSSDLAHKMFDVGVNMGIGRATQFLQRVLNVLNKRGTLYGDLQADGAMGPVTIASLKAFLGVRKKDGETVLLRAINGQQIVKYIEFSENKESQEDFTFGWLLQRTT
jgi:lysozyme family protein